MAEQRDVQALAGHTRSVIGQLISLTAGYEERRALADSALAALDGLVLEHTRQEEALAEALKQREEYRMQRDKFWDRVLELTRPPLSPPPVASGENA